MNALASIGERTIQRLHAVRYVVAVLFTALFYATRPTTWRRPARSVLVKQILFTGAEATGFTSRLAMLVGVSAVVQAQVWLARIGQLQYLGPILDAAIVRELGPLLANLIIIGRSGNAMAAELAIMKVNGEVRVLDAQGVDPFIYLLVPRVIATAFCGFCLSVIFIFVCLVSGYVCGALFTTRTDSAMLFTRSIAGAIGWADVSNLLIKSTVPGMFSAVICCLEGLSVGNAITDVPPAISRAVQTSVVVLFLISVTVSILTYI